MIFVKVQGQEVLIGIQWRLLPNLSIQTKEKTNENGMGTKELNIKQKEENKLNEN